MNPILGLVLGFLGLVVAVSALVNFKIRWILGWIASILLGAIISAYIVDFQLSEGWLAINLIWIVFCILILILLYRIFKFRSTMKSIS